MFNCRCANPGLQAGSVVVLKFHKCIWHLRIPNCSSATLQRVCVLNCTSGYAHRPNRLFFTFAQTNHLCKHISQTHQAQLVYMALLTVSQMVGAFAHQRILLKHIKNCPTQTRNNTSQIRNHPAQMRNHLENHLPQISPEIRNEPPKFSFLTDRISAQQ